MDDTLNPRDNFILEDEISRISDITSKSKDDVLREAIIVYKDYLDLLKEFEIWDQISDEDFDRFEKAL